MKNFNVASMGLIILGVVLFLFTEWEYAIIVYGLGALVFTIIRLLAMLRYRSVGKDISRLPQIRVLSAASLLGAGYLMYDGSNSWSILFLVSAVLEMYVSYRDK